MKFVITILRHNSSDMQFENCEKNGIISIENSFEIEHHIKYPSKKDIEFLIPIIEHLEKEKSYSFSTQAGNKIWNHYITKIKS